MFSKIANDDHNTEHTLWCNISSGNSLFPDGAKPLPEP